MAPVYFVDLYSRPICVQLPVPKAPMFNENLCGAGNFELWLADIVRSNPTALQVALNWRNPTKADRQIFMKVKTDGRASTVVSATGAPGVWSPMKCDVTPTTCPSFAKLLADPSIAKHVTYFAYNYVRRVLGFKAIANAIILKRPVEVPDAAPQIWESIAKAVGCGVPTVILATTEEEIENWVHQEVDGTRELTVGFDRESDSFDRLCVIQLATRTSVLVAHFRRWTLEGDLEEMNPTNTPRFAALLKSKGVKKVGFGMTREVQLLNKEGFEVDNTETLEEEDAYGKKVGMKRLLAQKFGLESAKDRDTQSSDWGAAPLRPAQITYAAVDAFLSRELYLKKCR